MAAVVTHALEQSGPDYTFLRYGFDGAPVAQNNRRAPASMGWWAFPGGFERPGLVPDFDYERHGWHAITVAGDEQVYCSWDRDGELSRDAYFGSGSWIRQTVAEAHVGLRRLAAWLRDYLVDHPQDGDLDFQLRLLELEVFIPVTVTATVAHLDGFRCAEEIRLAHLYTT